LDRPFGVAVVGCGGVSSAHFSAYASHPDAELVAAVDVRSDLAESSARRWHAQRWYSSVAEALADPEVQIVDLCLPHNLHAPVATQAAKAGKHVFVEKPIANTLEEADRMITAAEENGVVLMVDQTKRYQNRHRRIKELLDGGYIGRPLLVRSAYEQDITYAWKRMDTERRTTYWKHDGVISGIGIHSLDLLRWLIGEVVEVQAIASTSDLIDPHRESEDSGIILLRFEDGCIGEVTVSYVLRHPWLASNWDVMPLQIFGRDGSIEMDEHDEIRLHSRGFAQQAGPGVIHLESRPAVGAPALPAEGMTGAIDHLMECLKTGAPPLSDGRDARRSLELVLAAYQSILKRQTVTLPLRTADPSSPAT
jgi:predicted dehydrogenase